MILLIDFEKAFDSVSLKFFITTLEIFNFLDKFTQWTKILLGMVTFQEDSMWTEDADKAIL